MALAVTLAVAVALAFAGLTLVLAAQVRRLRAEVAGLARASGDAGPSAAVAADAGSGLAPEAERRDEVVIRPTPLGPADLDLDLSVSRVASVTLSGSLIKLAALSSGVRRALSEESRMRVAHAFRRELRRQRRVRRKPAGRRP